MFDAPIAFAFTAGIFATVNPCGFAMLPAYLSYFLGIEGKSDVDGNARSSLIRAITTGAIVSLGFLVVFGVTGTLVTIGVSSIDDRLPWLAILIGVAMVALGMAMLFGFRLTFAIPKLEKGADGKSFKSLFLFGMSYAIASLSCAFPTFFVVVNNIDDFDSGVAGFGAYTLGMTSVLIALTVSLALARHSLLQTLRKLMQHVDTAAAILLIVAGLYTVYFWILDLADTESNATIRRPVLWVEQVSDGIRNWIRDTGGTRIGLVLIMVVAAAMVYIVARPGQPQADQQGQVSRENASSPH